MGRGPAHDDDGSVQVHATDMHRKPHNEEETP